MYPLNTIKNYWKSLGMIRALQILFINKMTLNMEQKISIHITRKRLILIRMESLALERQSLNQSTLTVYLKKWEDEFLELHCFNNFYIITKKLDDKVFLQFQLAKRVFYERKDSCQYLKWFLYTTSDINKERKIKLFTSTLHKKERKWFHNHHNKFPTWSYTCLSFLTHFYHGKLRQVQ